jgi:hypothetical protein
MRRHLVSVEGRGRFVNVTAGEPNTEHLTVIAANRPGRSLFWLGAPGEDGVLLSERI